MKAWVVVVAVGACTMLLEATGPLLLGSQRLRGRAVGVVELLAPVMLIALVVTQTVGGHHAVVVDARMAGVAAAGVALSARVPLIVAMAIAAGITVLVRHLS